MVVLRTCDKPELFVLMQNMSQSVSLTIESQIMNDVVKL